MADHGQGHDQAHEHGKMDIRGQEKTFAGFMGMVSYAIVIILVLVVFMTLANA